MAKLRGIREQVGPVCVGWGGGGHMYVCVCREGWCVCVCMGISVVRSVCVDDGYVHVGVHVSGVRASLY